MTKQKINNIINIENNKEVVKMDRARKVSDLITELYEIQKEYGDIECYGIEFYIEGSGEKNILTI